MTLCSNKLVEIAEGIWGIKSYGFYLRNGRTEIRNYGHELKNGKGMTAFEAQIKRPSYLVEYMMAAR